MLFAYSQKASSQVAEQYLVKPPILVNDTLLCWDTTDVVKMGNAYKDLASLQKQKDALYILYNIGQIDAQTYQAEITRLNAIIDSEKANQRKQFTKGLIIGGGIGLLLFLLK